MNIIQILEKMDKENKKSCLNFHIQTSPMWGVGTFIDGNKVGFCSRLPVTSYEHGNCVMRKAAVMDGFGIPGAVLVI